MRQNCSVFKGKVQHQKRKLTLNSPKKCFWRNKRILSLSPHHVSNPASKSALPRLNKSLAARWALSNKDLPMWRIASSDPSRHWQRLTEIITKFQNFYFSLRSASKSMMMPHLSSTIIGRSPTTKARMKISPANWSQCPCWWTHATAATVITLRVAATQAATMSNQQRPGSAAVLWWAVNSSLTRKACSRGSPVQSAYWTSESNKMMIRQSQ